MNRRDFDFGSDGLDATVLDLIDAEQRHPGPPPGSEARVRAAIAASIAAAALASSTAAASTAAASAASTATSSSAVASTAVATTAATGLGAKLGGGAVVVAAIAATAGGGLYVSSYDLEPAVEKPAVVVMADDAKPTPPRGLVTTTIEAEIDNTPRPTNSAPSTTTPMTKPRATTIEATRARPPRRFDIEVAPATKVADAVDEPARVAALAVERRQLGLARDALTANDGRQALSLLDGHRASWPEGQLVEEREALRVLALAQLDRRDEARSASSTFRARWPKSLFLDAIDRAVGR